MSDAAELARLQAERERAQALLRQKDYAIEMILSFESGTVDGFERRWGTELAHDEDARLALLHDAWHGLTGADEGTWKTRAEAAQTQVATLQNALTQIATRSDAELAQARTLHYDMRGWAREGLRAAGLPEAP